MEQSHCVVSGSSEWETRPESGQDFLVDGRCIVATNIVYTRKHSCLDSHAEIRLVFRQAVLITSISLTCNAKFIELVVKNEALPKYHSTMKGAATEQPNVFASETGENFECREIYFKILSIKPLLDKVEGVNAREGAVQLKIFKFAVEYTPLAKSEQPSDSNSMANAAGMNMMSMMALSMMAPNLAGGAGGVMARPQQGLPPGNTGMPNGDPSAGGMAALLGMAVAAMQSGRGAGGGGPGSFPGLPQPPSAPYQRRPEAQGSSGVEATTPTRKSSVDVEGAENTSTTTSTGNNTSNSADAAMNSIPAQVAPAEETISPDLALAPSRGIPLSNSSGSSAPATAASTSDVHPRIATEVPIRKTVSNQNSTSGPPAPAPASSAPALDMSQLASILWTVKGSILDDFERLLDRKLAPVLSRLDRIDAQLGELQELQSPSAAAKEVAAAGPAVAMHADLV